MLKTTSIPIDKSRGYLLNSGIFTLQCFIILSCLFLITACGLASKESEVPPIEENVAEEPLRSHVNSKDHIRYTTGADDSTILQNSIILYEKVVEFPVNISTGGGSGVMGSLSMGNEKLYQHFPFIGDINFSIDYNNSEYNYNETINLEFEIVEASVFNTLTSQNVPLNYSSEEHSNHTILNWNNPEKSDFEKVILRRSTSLDELGVLLYEGTEESYTDMTFGYGEVYYYNLSAVYINGSQSVTQSLIIFTDYIDTMISNFTIDSNLDSVSLRWSNSSDTRWTGVVVKRSLSSENIENAIILSEGSLVSSLSDTVSMNQTYTYYVYPVFENGLNGLVVSQNIKTNPISILNQFDFDQTFIDRAGISIVDSTVFLFASHPFMGTGSLYVHDRTLPFEWNKSSNGVVLDMMSYNNDLHFITYTEGNKNTDYYTYSGSSLVLTNVVLDGYDGKYSKFFVSEEGVYVYQDSKFYKKEGSGFTEYANISKSFSLYNSYDYSFLVDNGDIYFSLYNSLYKYDYPNGQVTEYDISTMLGDSIDFVQAYRLDNRSFFIVVTTEGKFTLFELDSGVISSIGRSNIEVSGISIDRCALALVGDDIYIAFSTSSHNFGLAKYSNSLWESWEKEDSFGADYLYGRSLAYDGTNLYLSAYHSWGREVLLYNVYLGDWNLSGAN